MVRRSRSFNPAEKNYVLSNASGQVTGSVVSVRFAHADGLSADESIGIPGRIKAVFVSSSLAPEAIAVGSTLAVGLLKSPGDALFSGTNPNAILSNVTQQHMILWYRMMPTREDAALKFIGWVKIPKRHQIFNEGDSLRWNMSVTSVGFDWSHCSNFVYKHTH